MTYRVLGIDPGAEGGAALWERDGKRCWLKWSCTVSTGGERVSVLSRALDSDLPLIVVAETWTRHGMGFQSSLGLGAEWGRWQERLDDVSQRCGQGGWRGPKVVRVQVNEWRRAVLGAGQMKKNQWKQKAYMAACLLTDKRPLSGDESEAILIGRWGCGSQKVRGMAPKGYK